MSPRERSAERVRSVVQRGARLTGWREGVARATKDGPQARRLLALAAIYDGATRTAAARLGGVTVQIVRDWVVKFNAHGPEGLVNRKPPGQPSKLTDAHRAALSSPPLSQRER